MRIKVKKYVDKFLEQSMKNMSINNKFVNFNQFNNNNFGNMNGGMGNMQQMYQMNMNMNNMGNFNLAQNWNNMQGQNNNLNTNANKSNNIMNNMMNNNKSLKVETEEIKQNNSNLGKFTCRFEIQIENDKEFQVARRLIGSKVHKIYYFRDVI